jgi:hypothetical protein
MALFGISAAATAVRGVETLDIIQLPAIGIWLIAGLLIAIATATVRAPGPADRHLARIRAC